MTHEVSTAQEPLRPEDVGIVLIGRNEGDRLRQCLDSLPESLGAAVYVDSGSTDGSVELARTRGVSVVELDLSIPFTAARARNAGVERLRQELPSMRAVQFVDGDCSLVPGWLEAAIETMDASPARVAVCGWRRERHPEASIYNRWCDLEWKAPPIGDVGEFGFGGDVLIRLDVFLAAGGYDETLIAGEDPEFCFRLRRDGGEVVRIDRDMTRHDADIHRFGQWWTRSTRSGHAFAEVAARYRKERLFSRNLRSIFVWGAALPLALVICAVLGPRLPVLGLVGVAILTLYARQVLRIAGSMDPGRFDTHESRLWGLSCMASQLPKAFGVATFLRSRRAGKRQALIEYK